ncbi:MAG TPA: outer membrane protein assembly factor BamB [Cellvibrio sp.]|nr:outer membrane protein assembly factor BamB [Cellvibrio sp.]
MMRACVRHLSWLVLLCAFSLSGCSWFSKKTGNEPMELVDFKETLELDALWSRGIGEGQNKGFSSLTPAMDGDAIYAVDFEGLVVALDSKTGKKKWTRKINRAHPGVWEWSKGLFTAEDPNRQIVGGIAAESGLLLVATYAGEVMALSKETGEELWRKGLPGEVVSAPRTNGNVVAAQTVNGKLFALDAKSGEQLWFYDNPPPVLTLRGTPSPIVTDSAIYAGFSNGRMMAFNPSNGLILWEQRIASPKGRSELERMVDIHSSPVIKDGVIYVGTYQGRISALARGTGRPLWGKDGSTSESMALSSDKLFVSHSDGKLVAYSSTSGEQLWSNEKMLRRSLNGPQVFGEYVAVVDFEGYMHVVNQSDGELVARTRVDRKGARAPMLTDGETLYVYTNSGDLIAFQAEKDD